MRHWVLMYETTDDKITWTSIALSGTSYQTFVLSCKTMKVVIFAVNAR